MVGQSTRLRRHFQQQLQYRAVTAARHGLRSRIRMTGVTRRDTREERYEMLSFLLNVLCSCRVCFYCSDAIIARLRDCLRDCVTWTG